MGDVDRNHDALGVDHDALGVGPQRFGAFGAGNGFRVVLDDGGVFQRASASAFGLAVGDDEAGAAERRLRTQFLVALLMTRAMRMPCS
ncbi:hypothetical protein O1L55_41955 [Streptomyces albulus]|nr:hypothetical protein [Streptomyces noursei]